MLTSRHSSDRRNNARQFAVLHVIRSPDLPLGWTRWEERPKLHQNCGDLLFEGSPKSTIGPQIRQGCRCRWSRIDLTSWPIPDLNRCFSLPWWRHGSFGLQTKFGWWSSKRVVRLNRSCYCWRILTWDFHSHGRNFWPTARPTVGNRRRTIGLNKQWMLIKRMAYKNHWMHESTWLCENERHLNDWSSPNVPSAFLHRRSFVEHLNTCVFVWINVLVTRWTL